MESRANAPSLFGIAAVVVPVAAVSAAVASLAAVVAMDILGPSELTLPTRCSTSTCEILVTVDVAIGRPCSVVTSSEIVLPPGVKAIQWRIITPGYSFNTNSVVFVDHPDDFGSATVNGAILTRSYTPPAVTRDYRYDIRAQGIGVVTCMVPTLPRIKNE